MELDLIIKKEKKKKKAALNFFHIFVAHLI